MEGTCVGVWAWNLWVIGKAGASGGGEAWGCEPGQAGRVVMTLSARFPLSRSSTYSHPRPYLELVSQRRLPGNSPWPLGSGPGLHSSASAPVGRSWETAGGGAGRPGDRRA